MTRHELPYLWAAKGRGGKLYWFYRRAGQRIPITDEVGMRLTPEHYGFLASYERLHASFGQSERSGAPGPTADRQLRSRLPALRPTPVDP